MARLRVSIDWLMGLIAVVACDCALVRFCMDDRNLSLGAPAAGLIVTAGVIAIFFCRRTDLCFACGFLVGACLATLGLVATLFLPAVTFYLNAYLTSAFRVLHPRAISPSRYLMVPLDRIVSHPGIYYVQMRRPDVEAVIGVPILIVAVAGGLLTLVFRRRERPNPAPDPTPT